MKRVMGPKPDHLVDEYLKEFDMVSLIKNFILSEDVIEKIHDKDNIKNIVLYQELSRDIIEKYNDIIHWEEIENDGILNEIDPFILNEYHPFMSMRNICDKQPLLYDQIKSFDLISKQIEINKLKYIYPVFIEFDFGLLSIINWDDVEELSQHGKKHFIDKLSHKIDLTHDQVHISFLKVIEKSVCWKTVSRYQKSICEIPNMKKFHEFIDFDELLDNEHLPPSYVNILKQIRNKNFGAKIDNLDK